MKHIFLGEALEIACAVVLVLTAVSVGVVFHRLALSMTLGLAASTAALYYFAQNFTDVLVKVRKPSLRKPAPLEVAEPLTAGVHVERHCPVCNDTKPDHTECNRVVQRTAATMRR